MPDSREHDSPSARPSWHILTGEYPPHSGGVSDYAEHVAIGLAAAGDEVHVWVPPARGPEPRSETPGVVVHREAGRWATRDLARLDALLDACPSPRRLLIQHTPNAWGRKGLNLGFGRWVARRKRRGDEVWMMVHEVAYPFWLRDRPWRWVLPVAHRAMIRDLLAVSDRVFHSNLVHGQHLRRLDPRPERPLTWLPVPCTVPILDDPAGVAAVRAGLAPAGQAVVGTFGTYGSQVIGSVLEEVFATVLAGRDDRVGLLLGRGGDQYAARVSARFPDLRGRLVAPGTLSAADVSRYLKACDVMVLPYSDGISTRRTTAMAVIAHGRPMATNQGHATEPLWAEAAAVALAPVGDAAALAAIVDDLLATPDRRAALGASAAALYGRRFSIERTVAALRAGSTAQPEIEPVGLEAYTGKSPQRDSGNPCS